MGFFGGRTVGVRTRGDEMEDGTECTIHEKRNKYVYIPPRRRGPRRDTSELREEKTKK